MDTMTPERLALLKSQPRSGGNCTRSRGVKSIEVTTYVNGDYSRAALVVRYHPGQACHTTLLDTGWHDTRRMHYMQHAPRTDSGLGENYARQLAWEKLIATGHFTGPALSMVDECAVEDVHLTFRRCSSEGA